MTRSIYIAFRSGAFTYDCQPCGRCCRGLGYADDLVHLSRSPALVRQAPYRDATGPVATPLVSFFTYADGCRFLGDDNLCDLHREGGSQAKPRICRLFPFSRLVDVDGLWTLLPHARCPWTASKTGKSALSSHDDIMKELGDDPSATLVPTPHLPRTPLPADARLALESAVRAAVRLSDTPRLALERARQAQAEHQGPPIESCARDVWLDLLRSAGSPPPLSRDNARLFVAALPTLRVLLLPHLPLAAIPAALSAFELWLRVLRELNARRLSGEDLLHLLDAALPLITVMAYAALPLPIIPEALTAPAAPVAAVWQALARKTGVPLGVALLELLRSDRLGPLSVLTLLGSSFPKTLWSIDS